jgi:glucosamine kinase
MKVVVGVDSGGSKTRALAVNVDGDVVGYAESGGGNPGHDAAFCENIRDAIRRSASVCGIGAVVRVVAGIAGYDRPGDDEWAEASTAVPGLAAARVQVNDAVIAHFGAMGGQSGITSIQGAGSMIFAKLEDGRIARNFDFRHYASAAGPWLGYRIGLVLLARGVSEGDEALVDRLLAAWGLDSLEDFRESMSRSRDQDDRLIHNKMGSIAPIVTHEAMNGSPSASLVCQEAAGNIVDGVRLLGRMFRDEQVSVTLIGSCVRSPAISDEVLRRLTAANERKYVVVDPKYSAVVGAVLLALEQERVVLDERSMEGLRTESYLAAFS